MELPTKEEKSSTTQKLQNDLKADLCETLGKIIWLDAFIMKTPGCHHNEDAFIMRTPRCLHYKDT